MNEDESRVKATTLLLLTTVLEDKLLRWPAENALMHYLQVAVINKELQTISSFPAATPQSLRSKMDSYTDMTASRKCQ